MKRFPDEFEALLSAQGRKVLKGTHPACGSLARAALFSSDELFEPRKIAGLAALMTESYDATASPPLARICSTTSSAGVVLAPVPCVVPP